ncbi:hypothetical protein C2869_09325 [Saccharobesus litoralis]|uniref:Caspase family p20 domain-containing protein n=1 Tax=Saccharobesus litoralis TaxID=2172099 RepID=A0A2S0VQX4_9ALTE|nr:caspase family protein [Saccharobesus litoralis]AWB66618.1 hypothetical protein C2869_09325 [Saccharobesus litoralis]
MKTSIFKPIYILLLVFCALVSAKSVALEKRIALVIGNSDYQFAPLKNPVNDAETMASTLSQLGFEVDKYTDLNREQMESVIGKFGQRLVNSKVEAGLFYFAGHGVSVKGVNYLIPIGEGYSDESDVESKAVDVSLVMSNFTGGKLSNAFVVLDACRNNPFGSGTASSLRQDGLSRMMAPSGTLIAYATIPGATASDGAGDNGLYTSHLVNSLRVPGLSAEQVFKRTRERVENESNNSQSPREESSLKGADFYFLPLDTNGKIMPEAVELAYWNSIVDSQSVDDFSAYLAKYPKGQFVALAQNKIARAEQQELDKPGIIRAASGYAALKKRQFDKARKIFEKLTDSENEAMYVRGIEGLALVSFEQGKVDEAQEFANEVLDYNDKSSVALLVKARVAFAKGKADEASDYLNSATAKQSTADFSWQRALAVVSKGNANREKNPEVAKKAYQQAMQIDKYSVSAVTNLATLLRDEGKQEQALNVLNANQHVATQDRIAQSLAFQIQQEQKERNDLERQKQIDNSVKELLTRFEQQKSQPQDTSDPWTSRPVAISVLGFQEKSVPLTGRIGMADLLSQEMQRELRVENVKVVDRALIDKILNELKLTSSALADPQTRLKLGRLTAARVISFGNIYYMNNKTLVSFRLIDTETTQIIKAVTETIQGEFDPTLISATIAQKTAEAMAKAYPRQGRIAMVEEDTVIINLGRDHNVFAGDLFNVLGAPQEVKFQGKVIGKKDPDYGQLRIASVQDKMAFAVPIEKKGDWSQNLRVKASF